MHDTITGQKYHDKNAGIIRQKAWKPPRLLPFPEEIKSLVSLSFPVYTLLCGGRSLGLPVDGASAEFFSMALG
ncbi:MAG: hypothetical protein D3908_12810 [Candidatus Electrothrix sp. AUS4]|nr:hypothetical protein [Candidatus Electrothrix sp. AUS4]